MKDAKFSRWWSIANIEYSLTIFYWTFYFLFLRWKKHNNLSLTFSKHTLSPVQFCDDGFLKNNNNDNVLRKVIQSRLLFTFEKQQYITNHRYDFICIFWNSMLIFVDMRCLCFAESVNVLNLQRIVVFRKWQLLRVISLLKVRRKKCSTISQFIQRNSINFSISIFSENCIETSNKVL